MNATTKRRTFLKWLAASSSYVSTFAPKRKNK